MAGGISYSPSQLDQDLALLHHRSTDFIFVLMYTEPWNELSRPRLFDSLRHRNRLRTDGSRPPEGLPSPRADSLLGNPTNMDLEARKIFPSGSIHLHGPVGLFIDKHLKDLWIPKLA